MSDALPSLFFVGVGVDVGVGEEVCGGWWVVVRVVRAEKCGHFFGGGDRLRCRMRRHRWWWWWWWWWRGYYSWGEYVGVVGRG